MRTPLVSLAKCGTICVTDLRSWPSRGRPQGSATLTIEGSIFPMSELIRLQKILAHAGCGSRRACETLIEEGRVTVDGAVIRQLGSKADPETQVIELDGQKVAGPGRTSKSVRDAQDKVYYMLNKPRGVLSTN